MTDPLAARVQALIDHWRKQAKANHAEVSSTLAWHGVARGQESCADALEAALAAAPLDPWTIRALRLFSDRVSAIPRYNCDCLPNGPDGKTMATDEQHAQDVDIFACERWVVLWEDVQSVLGIAQTVIDRADDDLFLMTGRAERAEAALAAALAPPNEEPLGAELNLAGELTIVGQSSVSMASGSCVGAAHFHDDRCYVIGAGDTEALICKWRQEGGMFSRREAADELAAAALAPQPEKAE